MQTSPAWCRALRLVTGMIKRPPSYSYDTRHERFASLWDAASTVILAFTRRKFCRQEETQTSPFAVRAPGSAEDRGQAKANPRHAIGVPLLARGPGRMPGATRIDSAGAENPDGGGGVSSEVGHSRPTGAIRMEPPN